MLQLRYHAICHIDFSDLLRKRLLSQKRRCYIYKVYNDRHGHSIQSIPQPGSAASIVAEESASCSTMFNLKKSLAAIAPLALAAFTDAQNTTSSAAASIPTINLDGVPNNTLDATAFALVYGSPLIQLINQTNQVYGVVGGANKINHQTGLASLSSAAVVKPNVDTLYSRIVIDLSQSDLVITVPNITDRYWIFPFYDAYVKATNPVT